MCWINILNMDKLSLDKQTLKKFGITMGIAFLVITVIIFIRHSRAIVPALALSVAFFVFGFFAPVFLKPVYIGWMKMAAVLSWVNTRLLLVLVFYLILSPIGMGLRMLNKDLLDLKIDKNKDSYWKKREKRFDKKGFERLF